MRTFMIAILTCLLVSCEKSPDKTAPPKAKNSPSADQEPAPAARRKSTPPAEEPQSSSVQSDDQAAAHPAQPRINKIIQDYVDSGVDGVVDVRTTDNGKIDKVVIVGAARISTVLGAADGLLTARKEARLRAAGKFRQFLKEKASIRETTESERIITLEGQEGGDLKESGKKISKNTEKYETVSEGIIRGLQVLGYQTVSLNQKEKMYVVVMGWDQKMSNAARNLAKELDRDEATGGSGAGDAKERRKLGDQQGVTGFGKDFFKK